MGILVNYALVNEDNMQLYPLHLIGIHFNIHIYIYIIYYIKIKTKENKWTK